MPERIGPRFNDLVVSTYGRGFWIMDDLTPLQQLTSDVAAKPVRLFASRAAYRFQTITTPMAFGHDQTVGQNPPYGASINYWLKAPPSGDVNVTILDPSGREVRRLTGTKIAGLNRVQWDLRGEPTRQVRMRTSADPLAPDSRELATWWPGVQVVVVDGANHGDITARPEFLAALRALVARN